MEGIKPYTRFASNVRVCWISYFCLLLSVLCACKLDTKCLSVYFLQSGMMSVESEQSFLGHGERERFVSSWHSE